VNPDIIMGDYDLRASYSTDKTPMGEFSGNASFNGCALFSGEVRTSQGIEAKLEGYIRFAGDQIVLNFLKRGADESRAIEFYVCKARDNSELLGAFNGVWRYRWSIRPSPSPNMSAYIKEILSTQDWITHPSIRENKVSMNFLPPTQNVQPLSSPEIFPEENLTTVPEEDLKITPAS